MSVIVSLHEFTVGDRRRCGRRAPYSTRRERDVYVGSDTDREGIRETGARQCSERAANAEYRDEDIPEERDLPGASGEIPSLSTESRSKARKVRASVSLGLTRPLEHEAASTVLKPPNRK